VVASLYVVRLLLRRPFVACVVALPGAGPRSRRKRARCGRFVRGDALERQAVIIRGCCDDGQGKADAAMMLVLRVK
jgi:hypothetical protein